MPAALKATRVPVPFPVKGIDQSQPRHLQEPLTCVDGLNVRSFPPFSDRLGGGKRPGTRRAWNAQFTSDGDNHRVLGMSSLITAIGASGTTGSLTLDLMLPDTTVSQDAGWETTPGGDIFEVIDDVVPDNEAGFVGCLPVGATKVFRCGLTTPTIVPAADDQALCKCTVLVARPGINFAEATDDGEAAAAASHAAGAPGSNEGGLTIGTPVSPGQSTFYFSIDLMVDADVIVALEAQAVYGDDGTWTTLTWQLTNDQIADLTAAIADWSTVDVRVRVAGDSRDPFNLNRVAVTSFQIVLSVSTGGGGDPEPVNFRGDILVLNRNQCRVAILPSDLGTDTLPTEEVSNAATTNMTKDEPIAAPAFGKWYVVDGEKSLIITPSATSSGVGSEPDVDDWATTVGTDGAGTLPANCRLTCVYRGRVVLARQEGTEPNASIWYMSRVLDPLDWDFAADDDDRPAETAAIAGSNQFVGQPADAITALIPFGDDYLIFGCAKSMWMMEGDPGQGGRVVNLTQQTGVLGARAWCFDESGTLWFVGSSGLYRYSKADGLVNVSGRRLYRVLDRLNAQHTYIQLAYNAFRKEVMVFMTPRNPPSVANAAQYSYTVVQDGYGTHVSYDVVNDAFFLDSLEWASMGPWSVLEIHGEADDDRTYLIGGNDGYIRRPFEGGWIGGFARWGTADDMKRSGSPSAGATGAFLPINSVVRTAAIEAPAGGRELMATEIDADGTDNNLPLALPLGALRWWLVTDDSPTKVTGKSVALAEATGTWFGPGDYGYQESTCVRACGGAHQVVLAQYTNTHSWAIGRMTLTVRPAGRRR